jgi:hypothetical protein
MSAKPLDFLSHLYGDNRDQRNPLTEIDEYLKPPQQFRHFEWELVAKIPKRGGDGQDVEVYELRAPSRFYKLVALPGENSIGKSQKSFTVSTGSGDQMGELIATMALAVSEGMISVDEPESVSA